MAPLTQLPKASLEPLKELPILAWRSPATDSFKNIRPDPSRTAAGVWMGQGGVSNEKQNVSDLDDL